MSRQQGPPVENSEYAETWKWIRRIGYAASALATVAILATTPYSVNPSDRAIVQRLGAYERTEGPGFHSQLPWPIESRHKISTQKIRRLELGYRTVAKDEKTGQPKYENHPEEVTMMTRDENVVIAEFSLQYEVKDPFAYSFNVKDPERIVHDISQAAMRRIIAQHEIDDVLLVRKAEMQVRAKEDIQAIADLYGLGVRVLVVQLGDVRAPPQVKPAFDDVQKAAEDREGTINLGKSYANKVIPEAAGNAYKLKQDAAAYRERVVNQARGDADRFLEIWGKYKNEPDITRKQLYLQEMRDILSKVRKVVVDKDVPINIFMGREGR